MKKMLSLFAATVFAFAAYAEDAVFKPFDMTVGDFLKKNIVFCIAVTAAIVTMFFVPIDSQYIQYFDFKYSLTVASTPILVSLS